MPLTTLPTGEIISDQAAPPLLDTVDQLGRQVDAIIKDAPADGDTLKELNDKIDQAVEIHGAIADLTDAALATKFPNGDEAQSGDLIEAGGILYRMNLGASDPQLAANWGLANPPTVTVDDALPLDPNVSTNPVESQAIAGRLRELRANRRSTHWVDGDFMAEPGQDLLVNPTTAGLVITLPPVATAIGSTISQKFIRVIDALNKFDALPPVLQADGTEEIRGDGIATPGNTLTLDPGTAGWTDQELRIEPHEDGYWVAIIEGRGLGNIDPTSFAADVDETLNTGIDNKAIAPDTFTGAVNQLLPKVDQKFIEESPSELAIAHKEVAIELSQIREVKTTTYSNIGTSSVLASRGSYGFGGRWLLPSGVQRAVVSLKVRIRRGSPGALIAEVWRAVTNVNDISNRIGSSEILVNAPGWETVHSFTFTQPIEIPNDISVIFVLVRRPDGGQFRYSVGSQTRNNSVAIGVNAAGGIVSYARFQISPKSELIVRSTSLIEQHQEVPSNGQEGDLLTWKSGSYGWNAPGTTAVEVKPLLEPKFLVATVNPGTDILGDRTFIPVTGALPEATQYQILSIDSDVAAGTNFNGLTVNPDDEFYALRGTAGSIPADWIKFAAGDRESWPIVGTADGEIRDSDRRLKAETISLPSSASIPPPDDGFTLLFLPETVINWDDWQDAGGRFNVADPTALPTDNTVDGMSGNILQIRYILASDSYSLEII